MPNIIANNKILFLYLSSFVFLVAMASFVLIYRARRFDMIYPNPLDEGKKVVLNSSCLEEPDPGACEAYIEKSYYDKGTGKCEIFIYGGCKGNVPFSTLEECRSVCELK